MAYITYNGKYLTHNGKYVVDQSSEPIPDSISLSIYTADFFADGTLEGINNVTVTSSGAWTAETLDTGDGAFAWADPASGSPSGASTIYCNYNDGPYRYCTIRFTCGTATADLNVTQYDYM